MNQGDKHTNLPYDQFILEFLRRISQESGLADRCHLYGITSLKGMLSRPALLQSVFNKIGPKTPCYLTIDLDVLSPEAIGHQVSTPISGGLEWYELFGFLKAAFSSSSIVGADIVEWNPLLSSSSSRGATQSISDRILHLLCLMIDSMGRRENVQEPSA